MNIFDSIFSSSSLFINKSDKMLFSGNYTCVHNTFNSYCGDTSYAADIFYVLGVINVHS